jgi:diguanylate cyclase (GGDEF)-like protein
MEDRLRFQSTHDSLTGLYNRLFFEEEIARLEHSRQFPISFIVIDLDKLKQVNDSDGHLAGDELLRRLAGVLRSTFRVEDIIARLGGDEFAVLLPNTGAVSLRRAVQRLRRNLTASNQACVDCLALSFSVGGATAELNSPLREALDRADRNMYRNKRSRNDS